jgi:hypothetical protein
MLGALWAVLKSPFQAAARNGSLTAEVGVVLMKRNGSTKQRARERERSIIPDVRIARYLWPPVGDGWNHLGPTRSTQCSAISGQSKFIEHCPRQ